MTNPSVRRPSRRSFRSRLAGNGRAALIIFVILVLALVLSARSLSNFWVDKLWYDSVGRGGVFWTMFRTKALLGFGFTLAFFVLALVSTTLADRFAPIEPGTGLEAEFVDRYRSVVGRWHRWIRVGACALFAVFIGWPMSGDWQQWLLFRNGASFGRKDANFGKDAGFYVFKLPFMTSVVAWSFAAFFLILVLTAAIHYLNGGIRLIPGQRHVTSQVKLHLSVILAAMALLKAVDYWLSQYSLTRSARGFVDGVSYTEDKAQVPALKLLILISLLAAVLLVVNVWQRGARLPVIAVGLWLVVAIVAGTVYPAAIQYFQVRPNPSDREAPYIANNIVATTFALGIDNVKVEQLPVGDVTSNDIAAARDALQNIRLNDPGILLNAVLADSSVATKSSYTFTDVDVDRYPDDKGVQRQRLIAIRSLDESGVPNSSWEAEHLQFTHGYGLAFTDAHDVNSAGSADYVNVASADNPLGVTRPEVYLSDGLGGYAIVGTTSKEVSIDDGPTRGYDGRDGVALSSTLRRAAFALHFGEWNIFGSRAVSDSSRVIFRRDIRARVRAIAPFLSFDADPYAVLVDGRIKWVIDAYTTSSRYPNAETADTRQIEQGSGLKRDFNYVRNSVKAVIDAYDGTVTLYAVDDSLDPIIASWRRTFPSLFTPIADAPPSLAAHFRYPEDLFRVQTNMYGRYRLSDSKAFYSRSQAWSVAPAPPLEQDSTETDKAAAANQPAGTAAAVGSAQRDGRALNDGDVSRFEPYYNMFSVPGQPTEFRLVRPFVPFRNDDKMVSLMTASSDPGSYGRLTVYEVAGGTLLGPSQVVANERTVGSQDLTLLDDKKGSKVLFGDLQIVPVGDGVIFVRPWFVQSTSGTRSKPTIKKVAATHGSRTVIGDTFADAIRKLFPGATVDPGSDGGSEGPGSTADAEQLLARANSLFDEAQRALTAGDLGEYQSKLEEAYDTARRAAELAVNGEQKGNA